MLIKICGGARIETCTLAKANVKLVALTLEWLECVRELEPEVERERAHAHVEGARLPTGRGASFGVHGVPGKLERLLQRRAADGRASGSTSQESIYLSHKTF